MSHLFIKIKIIFVIFSIAIFSSQVYAASSKPTDKEQEFYNIAANSGYVACCSYLARMNENDIKLQEFIKRISLRYASLGANIALYATQGVGQGIDMCKSERAAKCISMIKRLIPYYASVGMNTSKLVKIMKIIDEKFVIH